MGRRKETDTHLPARMKARHGKRGTTYYYIPSVTNAEGKRPWINLGKDLTEAKQKWAELERGIEVSGTTFRAIASRYQMDIFPTKAPATQKKNESELANLIKVFGDMHIEQIKPNHVRKYLTVRGHKAPVRANREKALLSHIFNYAREHGDTDMPNPCAGIRGHREAGRDRYVEDAEYAAVWLNAHYTLQDAMDLMLITGQRVSDVLKMRRSDISDGALWVRQNKTGKSVGIELEGVFEEIVTRILCRPRDATSLYLVSDDRGQPVPYWTLIDRFKKARVAAGVDFQLRDLRAKNATDAESIEEAKDRLGHSSYQMTQHYVRKRRGQRIKPGRGVKIK